MMKTMSTMRPWLRLVAAVCVLVCLLGCGTTHRVRRVHLSGFLKDYSQLREGGPDEALEVHPPLRRAAAARPSQLRRRPLQAALAGPRLEGPPLRRGGAVRP